MNDSASVVENPRRMQESRLVWRNQAMGEHCSHANVLDKFSPFFFIEVKVYKGRRPALQHFGDSKCEGRFTELGSNQLTLHTCVH